ncbi:hypothetical protein TKK_0014933 [Trichogramma kaykai]|uniref:KAT8 regulatory NSL complex subunit 3 n=1 Tax=Trichogramma kaykai TaxID=54128 RepID=A0ABD2WC51_9HYME
MLLNNTSSTTSSSPSVSTVKPSMPSPNSVMPEETGNNFLNYLRDLAGTLELEPHPSIKDHCYARPHNWKPDHAFVKPVKKLFFPKTEVISKKKGDEDIIDVVGDFKEETPPPFDTSKVYQAMDEFARVAKFVRPEETEDWEDKIDKTGWAPLEMRIFSRIVRILNSERLTRLAKANDPYEPIIRRASIDNTAKKFRETMASAAWDMKIAQWLHSLLYDHLPQSYLAIYLDILQSLRQKIPTLIDKMINTQPSLNSKGSTVTWDTLGPLLKKSWDPITPVLNANKPKKLPENPIFIVVPSGIPTTLSSRHSKWISQLGNLANVVTVNSYQPLAANKVSVMIGLEQLVQATRLKIQEVRVGQPGRPVVLLGFNTGAALACQVALLDAVTAIVCLGFPFNTADGKRGSPDDVLLDARCPIMFVIGQHAMLVRPDDIEDIRQRMLVPTSLVVVGSADDHLRISTSKKINEKISQSMVDRCIIDEIADFVSNILLQPHPLIRSASSVNSYENRNKQVDIRKRKVSANTFDNEPQVAKKIRTPANLPSIKQTAAVKRNASTSLSSPQPRKKSKPTASNTRNELDQIISATITPQQQQNLENPTGGITLNIGSFASLSSMGAIRLEPPTLNSLKTQSNAYFKVLKNNSQVSVGGQTQNIAKIKMIMPQKKVQSTSNSPRASNTVNKLNEGNFVPAGAQTGGTIKVLPPMSAVSSSKATSSIPTVNLPSIQHVKNININHATLKPVTSSNILFNPKSLSSATVSTTSATTTVAAASNSVATKVADINSSKKLHQPLMQQHSNQQVKTKSPKRRTSAPLIVSLPTTPRKDLNLSTPLDTIKCPQLPSKGRPPNVNKPVATKKTKTSPSKQLQSPQAQAESGENLSKNLIPNILDLPIIIAKDGTDSVPTDLPPTSTTTTIPSLVYINEGTPSQQPIGVKYTKIILAKRTDQSNSSGPVILTKTNKATLKPTGSKTTNTKIVKVKSNVKKV